jgi:effector-binding domain-containing protein
MNFLNKDIPVIVVSSSILMFLLFIITIILKIELIVTIMFVMPITVVSSTGMVLSYKQQQTEDARMERMKSLPKKSMKQVGEVRQKKTIPLKKIPRTVKPKTISKKGKKKEKKKTLVQIPQPMSAEELEEIKKTESEVDVEKQKVTCIVHKGPIEGNLYLCPHCKTFYCAKCAKTLKEQGEECWSCGKELDKPKEISEEMQKRISSLRSLVSHYTIRLNTLEHRFRVKALDKLAYYEEKESLTKNLNRYAESLEKLKKSL